jgi:tetratricopeptide (TPR) repeat protein
LGSEFYLTYVAMKQKDPKVLDSALRRWQPTIAVISVDHTPYWLFTLAHRRDWRMVYRDLQETVFLHESLRPDIPALPPPRAGTDYPAYDDAAVDRILRQAVVKPPPNLGQRLRGGAAYPRAELRSAGCFLQTDAPEAAIGEALAGLDRTAFILPELLLTLGHAYNARGEYRRADMCFDAFLRANPSSPRANDVRRARAGRQPAAPPGVPVPAAPAR